MEIGSSALIHKKLVSYQLQRCKSQLFLKLQDILTDSKIWSSKNSFIFIAATLQQALSFKNKLLKLNVLLLPFIREEQPVRALCSFPGVPADIKRDEQVKAH